MGIEAFQRQASGEDEDHVLALELSLDAYQDYLAKAGLPEKTPQHIFSEPSKSDAIAALEQAEMESLEARARDAVGRCADDKENWEASIEATRASISILRALDA